MPQQKSKKIFIYIFLFLIIGTLNNKNLSTDFLKIKYINVSGLEEKKNRELSNNLDFLKINNLFFLDEIKIRNILNKNNLIEKYTISKRYPSSLNIKIYKTAFLAKVKKDNKILLFGSNGKFIKKDNKDNKELDVPFIFGNFDNENFFELKKVIDASSFEYDVINNLYFFKSGRWDIETKSGLLIKLPVKNLKKSFELIIEILDQNNLKKINKIDLRQQNQIIINGK